MHKKKPSQAIHLDQFEQDELQEMFSDMCADFSRTWQLRE